MSLNGKTMNTNALSTSLTVYPTANLKNSIVRGFSVKQLLNFALSEIDIQDKSFSQGNTFGEHFQQSNNNLFNIYKSDSGNMIETGTSMNSELNPTQQFAEIMLKEVDFLKRYNIKKIYCFYATNEIWFLTNNFNSEALSNFDYDIFDYEKKNDMDVVNILVGTHEVTKDNLPYFDYEKEV